MVISFTLEGRETSLFHAGLGSCEKQVINSIKHPLTLTAALAVLLAELLSGPELWAHRSSPNNRAPR